MLSNFYSRDFNKQQFLEALFLHCLGISVSFLNRLVLLISGGGLGYYNIQCENELRWHN